MFSLQSPAVLAPYVTSADRAGAAGVRAEDDVKTFYVMCVCVFTCVCVCVFVYVCVFACVYVCVFAPPVVRKFKTT